MEPEKGHRLRTAPRRAPECAAAGGAGRGGEGQGAATRDGWGGVGERAEAGFWGGRGGGGGLYACMLGGEFVCVCARVGGCMHVGVCTCMSGCVHACWGTYMHVGVHICMLACVHTCWGAYMHVGARTYMSGCVRICWGTYMHVGVRTCMLGCAFAWVCMLGCIYACWGAYMHVGMCICVGVHVGVCTCVLWCIHVCWGVCLHVCACWGVHACTLGCASTCSFARRGACMCVHVCMHVGVSVFVCLYVGGFLCVPHAGLGLCFCVHPCVCASVHACWGKCACLCEYVCAHWGQCTLWLAGCVAPPSTPRAEHAGACAAPLALTLALALSSRVPGTFLSPPRTAHAFSFSSCYCSLENFLSSWEGNFSFHGGVGVFLVLFFSCCCWSAIVFAAQDWGWPGSGTAFLWERGWAGRSGGAAKAVLDLQGPKSLADWGAKSP
uniref:Uncharacterized protein n=1 Tax=Aquila chrysaetos chrysaetos TaxID=223781 RepID=A0A663DPD4_AQUCH